MFFSVVRGTVAISVPAWKTWMLVASIATWTTARAYCLPTFTVCPATRNVPSLETIRSAVIADRERVLLYSPKC